jgi:hypothetical protein
MKGFIHMKKIIIAIFAVALAVSLVACDTVPTDVTVSETTTAAATTETSTTTEAATTEVTTTTEAATTEATTTTEAATTTEATTTTEAETATEATTTTETATEADGMATGPVGDFINMIGDGEYYMEITVFDDDDGVETGTATFAVKAGNFKIRMFTEDAVIFGMFSDGKSYLFNEETKTYLVTQEDVGSVLTEITEGFIADAVKIGEGEEVINGETLPFEEYDENGTVIKYFIDGDSVYAIQRTNGTTIIFNEFRDNVSDDEFEIPEGYTEMTF